MKQAMNNIAFDERNNLLASLPQEKEAGSRPQSHCIAQFFVFHGEDYLGWDCFHKDKVSVGAGKDSDLVLDSHLISDIQAVFYFKGDQINVKREEAPVSALIPIFILIVLIVVIGVYPKPVTDILNSASAEFLDRIEYIRSVLG